MRLNRRAAPRSTITVFPSAIAAPLLHRVPVSPSIIRAGTSVVLLGDAVTVQPVRGNGVRPEPPSVTAPVSRTSREDAPTRIWYLPGVVVQPPVQDWKLRASRVTVTRRVWPGLSVTLAKPRRFFGGSPVVAGWPTYTWAASAPAREPVLLTSNDTATLPSPSGGPTARLAYRKLVYDRPNPNGNRGSMLCRSYQR